MSSDFGNNINAELLKPAIKDAEFIRLTITNPDLTTSVYALSNSYKTETVASTPFIGTYTSLGGLVSVSGHQRDLTATSYDTQITLVGIDKTKIKDILEIGLNPDLSTYHAGLKGAKIEIGRGFYNNNYNLIDNTIALRYTGIVTSYHISEDRQNQVDTFTLTLQCSSYKTVLENRFSGRHTNGQSWNSGAGVNIASTSSQYDTGMDRVQSIHDTTFNFGLPL
jgi:hypothetical protein